MIRRIVLALLLCLLAAPSTASPPAGTSLDWLLGSWSGRGAIHGRPSEAKLELRPVLGGKFLELSYRLSAEGPPNFSFEGRAFYRPVAGDDGGWQADWFDSRGMAWPIAAKSEGSVLTADWGSAETERGRTVYRLLADNRLEVVDTVRQADGRWREFARHLYQKVD